MTVIPAGVAKMLGLGVTLALALTAAAVAAEPQITLTVNPRVVTFASGENNSVVLLTGSVASGRANEDLMIEVRDCGSSSFVPMRGAHTDRGGAFHEPDAPAISRTYRIRAGSAVSAPVAVQVRPAIRFVQTGPARYSVGTIALRFFRGAKGRFERFNRSTGKWSLVRRVTLQRQSAPRGAGWAYSGAEFRARVPKGTLVRFVLPRDQARPCYLAGYSLIFNTSR
jgi:hypothetical protein